MERLTRRVSPTSYQCSKPADKFDGYELIRANQKLGKLEDIEEELGISLEVLFKALLRGILDEDGKHHSKVRLSNKLGYMGLVDEEGYCWDTKKYLSKWWILGGEYDD